MAKSKSLASLGMALNYGFAARFKSRALPKTTHETVSSNNHLLILAAAEYVVTHDRVLRTSVSEKS